MIMHKPLLLLSLLFTLSACQQDTQTAKTDEPVHDHSKHQHQDVDMASLGENIAKPELNIQVTADSSGGWNLYIDAKNFSFTPEKIDQAPSANEGHAHLYIDGFKMARIYSNWYHIKALTAGEHTVRITLNANDHSPWQYQGQPLEASTTINQ